ncbi:MAG: ribosome maturation factor RimP [Actinomycetota bacterium]|jgi:ribosome maturation factor RimP|nr:ribosome maturation factor RimP [Actinomycetota bacterium]
MGSASDRESLRRALEPVVTAEGFDLEDVVVTPAGKRRMLRVVVDKDGGVDLDDIARVSTTVSGALDASDAMGGAPYVLEVTSPGVDRPLTQPRHWRRAAARLVTVGVAGVGERTGRVLAVDDDGVDLQVDGDHAGEPLRVPWVDLGPGRVQVEFNRSTTREE